MQAQEFIEYGLRSCSQSCSVSLAYCELNDVDFNK